MDRDPDWIQTCKTDTQIEAGSQHAALRKRIFFGREIRVPLSVACTAFVCGSSCIGTIDRSADQSRLLMKAVKGDHSSRASVRVLVQANAEICYRDEGPGRANKKALVIECGCS